MSDTPTASTPATDAATPEAPPVAPEGRKPAKPSSGTAHVAVVGIEYTPTGGGKPKRCAPGDHLTKCPPDTLAEYLERGDVVAEADYGDPEACARAAAMVAPEPAIEPGTPDDNEGSEPA